MPVPPKKIISEGLTMVATAFGFVAALAWNEAVKGLIEKVVPRGQGLLSLFIYAVAVTVIAVIISLRLINLKERMNPPREGVEHEA